MTGTVLEATPPTLDRAHRQMDAKTREEQLSFIMRRIEFKHIVPGINVIIQGSHIDTLHKGEIMPSQHDGAQHKEKARVHRNEAQIGVDKT